MKCKYCEGQGQIYILTYRIDKSEKDKLGNIWVDCPKCNGTGKVVE